jgi:capsid protein
VTFDELLDLARGRITALGEAAASLPSLAADIAAQESIPAAPALTAADCTMLDELFARYTMERERDVHRDVLQRFGFGSAVPVSTPAVEEDDGILLF